MPQFIKNRAEQSTAGLSAGLVLTWLAGDAAKMLYFSISGAPLQFLACAIAQVGMDLAVLWQMYWLYGRPTWLLHKARTLQAHSKAAAWFVRIYERRDLDGREDVP